MPAIAARTLPQLCNGWKLGQVEILHKVFSACTFLWSFSFCISASKSHGCDSHEGCTSLKSVTHTHTYIRLYSYMHSWGPSICFYGQNFNPSNDDLNHYSTISIQNTKYKIFHVFIFFFDCKGRFFFGGVGGRFQQQQKKPPHEYESSMQTEGTRNWV